MNKSMVIRPITAAVAVIALSTVAHAQAPAQSPATPSAPKAEKVVVPLKVVVTISRYEGEKKTSSLPFTIWVNANDGNTTTLNLAASVPYADPSQNVQYRNLGTSMTCSVTTLDDGRFKLSLNISDSTFSPGKDKTDRVGSLPVAQSLSSNHYLLLRDGQVAQFLSATDKVTGEVTKVDITVSVLK